MSEGRPRLLWTDDDGRERFLYEEYVIRDEGWEIAWAEGVSEASRLLAREPFDALILDQMMPYEGLRQNEFLLWGGCLLLRWLRGAPPPAALELELDGGLYASQPLDVNRDIPAFVVSGFYDASVAEAFREASPQDRDLRIMPKPVEVDEVLRFLRDARPLGRGRP